MSHQCSSGSCNAHHHHHHDHDSCCSHDEESHCSCCHGDHECHDKEDFAAQLLEMADDAWMEVLHEKIKAQILATSGAHLDELAKIVTDANKARWTNKMASKGVCEHYKESVDNFFSKKQ